MGQKETRGANRWPNRPGAGGGGGDESTVDLAEVYLREEAKVLRIRPEPDGPGGSHAGSEVRIPLYQRQEASVRAAIGELEVIPPLLVSSVGINPVSRARAATPAPGLSVRKGGSGESPDAHDAPTAEAGITPAVGAEPGPSTRYHDSGTMGQPTATSVAAASGLTRSPTAEGTSSFTPGKRRSYLPFHAASPESWRPETSPPTALLRVADAHRRIQQLLTTTEPFMKPEVSRYLQLAQEVLVESHELASAATLPHEALESLLALQWAAMIHASECVRETSDFVVSHLAAVRDGLAEMDRGLRSALPSSDQVQRLGNTARSVDTPVSEEMEEESGDALPKDDLRATIACTTQPLIENEIIPLLRTVVAEVEAAGR